MTLRSWPALLAARAPQNPHSKDKRDKERESDSSPLGQVSQQGKPMDKLL